jgi:hypothetical protein
MHSLGDELASTDKPIDDDGPICYIFTALDYEYKLGPVRFED